MLCPISVAALVFTSGSIAGLPCPGDGPREAPPRVILASLELPPPSAYPRQRPAEIAKPKSSARIFVKDNGAGHFSTLVVITKAATFREKVARENAEQFRGFLQEVADTGYPIFDLGCYSPRYIDPRYTGGAKILSQHGRAKACDINQCRRNRVGVCHGTRLVKAMPFPASINAIAHKHGLKPGAEWSSPDAGHFEIPATYAQRRQWPRTIERQQVAQAIGRDFTPR